MAAVILIYLAALALCALAALLKGAADENA